MVRKTVDGRVRRREHEQMVGHLQRALAKTGPNDRDKCSVFPKLP